MREQKRKRLTIGIVILCLLVMVGAVYVCSYQVRQNLKIEMQNTLRDVARQNNVAVQTEVDSRFWLLYSIAAEMEESEEYESTVDAHKHIAENYRFERVGFVYGDGSVYTIDGYEQNLAEQDFFCQGMKGITTLTESVEEMEGHNQEYVSRFAVPVYNNGRTEVVGVLFATYRAQWLAELLNSQAFEGRGYGCLVREDGAVIAHSAGSPLEGISDFFACLSQQKEGLSEATDIRGAMEAGESGIGKFLLKDAGEGVQDFYYTPLELDTVDLNRYMVTMVPAQVLEDRMQPIMGNVEQMCMILLILLTCAITIFLLFHLVKRRQLMKLAYSDSVTHGENFACFQEKIKRKKGMHGFLIAMDISGFKIINYTCGVSTGDAVLRQVWHVLSRNLGANELAARIYADRFVLFFTDETKEALTERVKGMIADMEKISESLNTPRIVPVIGIHETNNQEPLETDYGKAIQAKHQIKGRRDRIYAFYDEIDYEQVLEKRSIEDGFEEAIATRQFEIWYQPKYDAATSEIVGAEALVRWRRADGSLLPPIKFIPIFEKNGMISRLDEYVFNSVCAQQKKWELEGKKILPVSVNISRISLYYYDIVDKYKVITRQNEVDTKYLQLEITESATIGNAEISNLIEAFHMAGFAMLLDDFGSGYSSLSSLNMMHFDTMKLDKSLIDYIGDANGEKLLHYIMRLGQSMGLSVTAEGVETKEQVEFLRKLKCNDIQGYYFSKPLRVEEYEKLLA